jgi:hypothetical protein
MSSLFSHLPSFALPFDRLEDLYYYFCSWISSVQNRENYLLPSIDLQWHRQLSRQHALR